MASDIFAKLGDIKGESLDDKHKDEIEVLSWSWGVTQTPARWPTAAAAARARRASTTVNFTHHVDKASPVLMKACATGEHIKEATITHRKAGKGQQEFLIVKMNDVIITSVTHGGSGDGGTTENVSAAVREGRPRVQAAEARRIARCRHPLQVRHQGQQGRLTAVCGV